MKTVTGITNGNSNLIPDWFWDMNQIDLTYEEAIREIEEDSTLSEDEKEQKLDELGDECVSGDFRLVGDWRKNANGLYEIDKEGKEGFAATYDSNDNYICIEWSNTTKECRGTSPCFRMVDGSPCGDLDSEGDTVIAYTFPK